MSRKTTTEASTETTLPNKRGRPALPPAEQVGPEFVGKMPEHIAEMERTAHGAVEAYAQERDLVNQLLGQAQAADAIKQISQTIGVSKLAYVKENKLYRALRGMKTPNGLELLGTWEEFCNLLGYSDEKINQDIANLKFFGEEALESMGRMGIGYRELRQYRRLPEDEKIALIEVAKTNDKDAFVELAETIIAKHAQEKEAMAKEISDAKADYQALDKVAKEDREKLTELKQQNAKLLSVTDMWDTHVLGATDEISGLGTVGDEVLGKHLSFIDVCEVLADKLDPEEAGYKARLEQARVPIARLGEQLKRWGHIVARLQFEFDNRLSGYLDNTFILPQVDGE